MPTPTYIDSQPFGSTFAFSLSGSFDVGPDPVTILAWGVVAAGSSVIRMDSITLNPGGSQIVMNAGTDRSIGTEFGAIGRARKFDAIATGLTGVVNFTAQCTTLAGVADNNGKPGVLFSWYKDVVSVSSENTLTGIGVTGGGTLTSPALSSGAGQVVAGLVMTDLGTVSGVAGVGGTVINESGFSSDYITMSLREAGAGSTSLQLSTASTGTFMGHLWNLVGSAVAPTISAQPSNASVTAPSTANFAASVSGTYTGLRWQRQAAGAGAWTNVSGGTGGTTTSFTTGATAVSGGSFNSTDKFRLAVDWSGGVVTSGEVTLTVIAAGTAPSFSVQPSNQSATVGGTATFNFTVSGSGSLTVQARKNGTDVGSPIAVTAGVSGNYTTSALLIGDSGAVYSFVATGNTAPTATSSNATLTVLQPIATTFTFSFNGGNSLTGLKYAVFDQVTPDLWVAPVKKASNGSSNGSGLVTIDVTGLTARRIGELGSVFATNSDGTATGGAQAATRKAAYCVGVFS